MARATGRAARHRVRIPPTPRRLLRSGAGACAVLAQLGRGAQSISALAAAFDMTLTGVKKHVRVLEDAGLVTTEKAGRVRTCRLGPRRLEDETAFIEAYRETLEDNLDRLGGLLERTRKRR